MKEAGMASTPVNIQTSVVSNCKLAVSINLCVFVSIMQSCSEMTCAQYQFKALLQCWLLHFLNLFFLPCSIQHINQPHLQTHVSIIAKTLK
jgi:hypothetical protein